MARPALTWPVTDQARPAPATATFTFPYAEPALTRTLATAR